MPERQFWQSWPDELENVDFWINLERDQLDFSGLKAALEDRPGFAVRNDRISSTLREPAKGSSLHGHAYFRSRGANQVQWEFLITRGSTTLEDEALSIQDFLTVLEERLRLDTGGRDIQGIVDATLDLPIAAWQPTIPLPVILPGMLDGAEGSPQVAGFDFGFRDSSNQLRRAYIGLSESAKDYAVRFRFRLPMLPLTKIIDRAVAAIVGFLPLVATPLVEESSDINAT
jgi:hypothetical protein